MAMMDRVIGGKGCSFSAMIALKLFGNKKRVGMKKDMDFDENMFFLDIETYVKYWEKYQNVKLISFSYIL